MVNGSEETKLIPIDDLNVNMVTRNYISPYFSGDVISVASADACTGCQVSLTVFSLDHLILPCTPAFYVGRISQSV